MKVLISLQIMLTAFSFQVSGGLPYNCNGNECPGGMYHENGSCRCCMDCEEMYDRISLKTCPLTRHDCGECKPGYTPNLLLRPNDLRGYCKPDPQSQTYPSPSEALTMTPNTDEHYPITSLYCVGILMFIIALMLVFVIIVSYWKTLKSNQRRENRGPPIQELNLQSSDSTVLVRKTLKEKQVTQLKEPEENEDNTGTSNEVPLVRPQHKITQPDGRNVENDRLTQAQPINPNETTSCQTFANFPINAQEPKEDNMFLHSFPNAPGNGSSNEVPFGISYKMPEDHSVFTSCFPNSTIKSPDITYLNGIQGPFSRCPVIEDCGLSSSNDNPFLSFGTDYSNATTVPLCDLQSPYVSLKSLHNDHPDPSNDKQEGITSENVSSGLSERRMSFQVSVEVAAEQTSI